MTRNTIYTITIPRMDLFLTSWAVCAHILCLFGMFYNTMAIAIFICIGAEIHNRTINKEVNMKAHLWAHYLPLVLLIFLVPFELDIRPILILLIAYMLYHKFNLSTILKYYEKPKTFAVSDPITINLLL